MPPLFAWLASWRTLLVSLIVGVVLSGVTAFLTLRLYVRL